MSSDFNTDPSNALSTTNTTNTTILKICPRLAEFTHEHIPLEEILDFYSLSSVLPPTLSTSTFERPYTWSNSVISLDGVLHFLDPGTSVR
ncbi:hypothetical protein BC829DRAFT_405789 [Chytridium lagenaria]|nr:hypothetical protein BC829DRAFT_405789 [Chytridium lagenaria]